MGNILETLKQIPKSNKPIILQPMRALVLGLCLCAFVVNSASAADPLTAQLAVLPPLPTVTPTFPFPDRIVDDPDLLREVSRVLRCASTSLRYAPPGRIRKLVDAAPETIALNYSPYHDKFQSVKWTKAEVCGPITPKDLDYMAYFWQKASQAEAIIGDIPVIVIFDHEPNMMKGPPCLDDGSRGDKLNVFYRMAKDIFGGDVFWYNDSQRIPGSGASTTPRNTSPIPPHVHGDYASLSMYHNIHSTWCMETLRHTAEATERDLVVWVSIGGVYELWPWTPRGHNRRSPNVTWVPQLGETWYAGWWLYDRFPKDYPDKFGPVDRIKYVMWWPPPLKLGDEHFLEFLRGALEIRHD